MNLSNVPVDALQRCLQFVTFADILRLFLTGSLRLKERLLSEPLVCDAELQTWSNPSKTVTCLPRLVLQLQHLRTFKLVPSHPANPPRAVSGFLVTDLPSSLHEIHLECANVQEIVNQGNTKDFVFLQRKFPFLSSLYLRGPEPTDSRIHIMLFQVPSFLRHFSAPNLLVGLSPSPAESSLLTHLHVSSLDMFSKQKSFPPSLLHLTLEDYNDDETVLGPLLPPTLTTLIFIDNQRHFSADWTQSLPRGLIHLKAPIRAHEQSLKGLPAGLTKLCFSRNTSPCPEFFQWLPRELTYLDCTMVATLDMDHLREAPATLRTLKLGQVYIPADVPSIAFPSNLTKLTIGEYPFQPHGGVITCVPSTVRSLSIGEISSEYQHFLPRFLTRLCVSDILLTTSWVMALPSTITDLCILTLKLMDDKWPAFPRGIRKLELSLRSSLGVIFGGASAIWPSKLQQLLISTIPLKDDDVLNLPAQLTHLEVNAAFLTADSISVLKTLPLRTLILQRATPPLLGLSRLKTIPSLFIDVTLPVVEARRRASDIGNFWLNFGQS